jgi:hypothetical protein
MRQWAVAWIAFAGLCLTLAGHAGQVSAEVCTNTATCREWLALPAGPDRVLVYRSHALTVRNESITRALVAVHGAGRDADHYFRHALAAAFLAAALDDTVVIAPRFAANDGKTCRDILGASELRWACLAGPESWRVGGAALDAPALTAFDVADELLRTIASGRAFPSLRAIVLAGHSAGGQFVNRYQMSGQAHDGLRVPVTYVVANPSSYAYLDSRRPTASALPANITAGAPGYSPPIPAEPPPAFVPFADARNCTTFDGWPFGLRDRVGYTARIADERLKQQLAARPTVYLLGELDILPLARFDASCPAMAQGPTRLARGLAYGKYVNEQFSAQHRTVVVPACGHNGRCMFTAEAALPVLFPKQ